MKQVVQAGEVRSARVESLRALAALSVFMVHSVTIANLGDVSTFHGLITGIPMTGGYGVEMFFCLTGFLLFSPFVSAMTAGTQVDVRKYLRNRLLRILPLYYLSIPIALLLLGNTRPLQQNGWLYVLLVIPSLSWHSTVLNPVMWSVSAELQFYLALPLLAFAIAYISKGRRTIAAAILIGLGVGCWFLHRHWAHVIISPPGVRPVPGGPYRTALSYGCYFVPGMLLALISDWMRERKPSVSRGVHTSSTAWIGLGLIATFVTVTVVREKLGMTWLELFLLPSVFFVLGGAVLPLRRGHLVKCLEFKPLAQLGLVSYSFYVLHRLILVKIAGGHYWPTMDFYLLSLTVVILASILSYRLIESPFLRLRKRWSPAAAVQAGDNRRADRIWTRLRRARTQPSNGAQAIAESDAVAPSRLTIDR